ncbi:hypothetical protein [Azotobacter vinelandii]|uniref:hypothetical protein n=1 Tax=Azotobacter vinelandii TaxID=354 RepID=UPI0026656A3E|nr:hypothetical protein [Azotobacter vinelandii]WKN20827.1 hypothetical protein AVAEIV_003852 [Azotobacter vinelandii]
MDKVTVTMQVKIAWWWPAYVAGVHLMSWLTGLDPDMAKVERWVRQAVSVRVEIP